MKNGYIKTAAAVPQVRVADCSNNADEILKQIRSMEDLQVKIMVLPELCLTGYTCSDLFLQSTMLENAGNELIRIMNETSDTDAIIFIGFPLDLDGRLYNTAAVLCRGRVLGFVPKKNIPNYNEFYEARHFTSGPEKVRTIDWRGEKVPFGTNLIFTCREMPHLKIAAEICEDLWVPCPPSTRHAIAGATVIVNLSASNDMVGKDGYRRSLVLSQSGSLVCGYIYCSAGEGESTTDLVFGGHTMVAENGSMLAESRPFEKKMSVTEIDVNRLDAERRRMSTYPACPAEILQTYETVYFDLHAEKTELTRTYPRFPFVPSDIHKREERCEQILTMQAVGLKTRLAHIHAKNAVIGISGGLDSTLALLVTARAFDLLGIPRSQITAVTMPCFGTTDRTYTNACMLTKKLGAQLKEVNIKAAVTQHFKDIGHDPSVTDVTYENCQARERTQVLMDIANQSGGIVIGTGDLSELALGWATYNGDHMSMYAVNVSVPKTLVRHLVHYTADTCGETELSKVLNDILDTPVSPELLPPSEGQIAQKTEDLVGPYELHDFFLYYMLRAGFEPQKIYRIALRTFNGIYDREIILKWLKTFYRRFFAQQFKRSCLPDGPKVGSVAISPRGDLRMPSDASAEGWLASLNNL